MNVVVRLSVVLLALLTGTVAHAQSAVDLLQRNVDQQVAIQQGLQFGFLTVQEAADFTLRQANIEALQVEVLRDGWLGAVDAQRVAREQEALADLVARSTRNWQVGDPYLPEAQRLLAQLNASIAEQQRLREALLNGQIREMEVGRVLQQQAQVDRQAAEQALGPMLQPAPQVQYREYREPLIAPSFMLQFGNDRSAHGEREWLRQREILRQREMLREFEERRERREHREREARHQMQERAQEHREDHRDDRREEFRREQQQEQRQDRREEFRQEHRADKPVVIPVTPVAPRQQSDRPQTPAPAAQAEQRGEPRGRSKDRGNDDDDRRRGRRDQTIER